MEMSPIPNTVKAVTHSVRVIGKMPELREVDRHEYDLGEELGRGGLGRVVSAVDHRLRRPVALKELLEFADDDSKKRFVGEALVTARLQHPSIIPIYEVGRWPDGEQFYTMRPVDGASLDEKIKAHKTLAERLPLLTHVIAAADAIGYAHSQNIIHRDIKPANILVGNFGETVVIDWGTAKELTASGADAAARSDGIEPDTFRTHTVDGSVMGTPAYMSPEQASNRPVDQRTDVYSLGAVLYHLLSGQVPFDGCTLGDTVERVRQSELSSARLPSNLPVDLRAILRKATQKTPANRYPSAKELADDLKRYQDGQLVAAYRYTPLDFLRHWMRTRRLAVLSFAISLLFIFLTMIYTTFRFRTERDTVKRQNLKLVLAQARSVLPMDPTKALAWLKQWAASARNTKGLRDHSEDGRSSWDEMVDIALEAISRHTARHVFRPGRRNQLYGAYSPNGRLFAWAGPDKTIVLRDTTSGEVVYRWPGNAVQLLFSPVGSTLATLDSSRPITLRDCRTGSVRELRAATGDAIYMSYSPDGTRLLVIYNNHLVRLWDVATGTSREFFGADGTSGAARFSPDGKWFAYPGTGDQGFVIYVYATQADVAQKPLLLRGHRDAIASLSFSPDGRFLVSGSQDQTSRHWDLASETGSILSWGQGAVLTVLYSRDNRHIAVSADRSVQVWDRDTGKSQDLGAHEPPLYDMSFSHDGRLLAWGTANRVVVHDFGSNNTWVFRGHEATVNQVLFSPDGKQLASNDYNGTARLWDIPTERNTTVKDIQETPAKPVQSRDGRLVAALGQNQTIWVWDLRTGETRSFSTPGQQVWRLALSSKTHLLATGDVNGTIRLWDIDRGTFVVKDGSSRPIKALAFSPDGTWIAAAGSDNRIRRWRIDDDTPRELPGACDSLSALVWQVPFIYSDNGRWLAAPCAEGSVRLWDLTTDSSRELRGHDKQLTALSFSHDGQALATASDDALWLWTVDQARGQRIRQGLIGSHFVRFSSDDRSLVYAAGDAVSLWDRKSNTHRILAILPAQASKAMFSPDGTQLALGDFNGVVRLWDTDTQKTIALFHHEAIAAVLFLSFSPNGDRLFSAGGDHALRGWPTHHKQPPLQDVDALSRWLQQLTTAMIDRRADQVLSP